MERNNTEEKEIKARWGQKNGRGGAERRGRGRKKSSVVGELLSSNSELALT